MTVLSENGVGEEQAERRPTERVVLRQVRAIEIPPGTDPERVAAAVEALHPKAKRAERDGSVIDAWQEVARVEGATKTAAVESYAGKPGTPDAKVGTFRAPGLTAWKGAMVYDAPPLPLVERRVIE